MAISETRSLARERERRQIALVGSPNLICAVVGSLKYERRGDDVITARREDVATNSVEFVSGDRAGHRRDELLISRAHSAP